MKLTIQGKDMAKEVWKDIDGYGGDYQVSNTGKVKSKKRNDDFLLKHDDSSNEYHRVTLFRNNKRNRTQVHRLVAKAFIPNPENKPYINHKDGDKSNNHVGNLEWCTQSENVNHAYKTGLKKGLSGEKHHRTNLTKKDVLQIRFLREYTKLTQVEIASMYNVGISCVRCITNRHTWKHI